MGLVSEEQGLEKHLHAGGHALFTSSPHQQGTKTVLIVDDDQVLLTMISSAFRTYAQSCNVLSAEDGAEAIEIIESVPVDAVITDLKMPVTDGYKVIAHVKEHKPGIRIFAMTGDFNPEVKERLLGLGVAECLEKPFNLEETVTKVAGEEIRGVFPTLPQQAAEGIPL